MNNGEPIDLDLKRLTQKEKNEYAETFSEGSTELKKLLLKMWDNGIKTYACCKGHIDKLPSGILCSSFPYISFSIDGFTEMELKSIITKVLNCFDKGLVSFTFAIDFYNILVNKEKSIALTRYNTEEGKELFSVIDNILFGKEDIEPNACNDEFIKTILEMYCLSTSEYRQKCNRSPILKFSRVAVLNLGPGEQIYLSTRSCVENVKIRRDNEYYYICEGYYTKTKDGSCYTLDKNMVKELSVNEIKDYKKYGNYKKYLSNRPFNLDELKDIIQEIKKYQ